MIIFGVFFFAGRATFTELSGWARGVGTGTLEIGGWLEGCHVGGLLLKLWGVASTFLKCASRETR